jgi:hypothetical protein
MEPFLKLNTPLDALCSSSAYVGSLGIHAIRYPHKKKKRLFASTQHRVSSSRTRIQDAAQPSRLASALYKFEDQQLRAEVTWYCCTPSLNTCRIDPSQINEFNGLLQTDRKWCRRHIMIRRKKPPVHQADKKKGAPFLRKCQKCDKLSPLIHLPNNDGTACVGTSNIKKNFQQKKCNIGITSYTQDNISPGKGAFSIHEYLIF